MLVPKQEQAAREMRVTSLFTCGMGMDIGFAKAGFSTVYSNDITKFACDTIRRNRPGLHCDEGDIMEIRSEQILERAGVQNGEADVVIGGPPCQSFSTAGMRRDLEDKRSMALLEFIRVVREVQPKSFVFENVSGLVSMAKKHVPFYDRISAGGRTLPEDQKYGSLFADILLEFEKIDGYRFQWKLLNAADYGVPQTRRRYVILASRKGKISIPQGPGIRDNPRTVRGTISRFSEIGAGESDVLVPNHTSLNLSPENLKRMRLTPKDGGSRQNTPESMWIECHMKHVGHTDTYGRMRWDRPLRMVNYLS